jgi:hypothetical protein
MKIPEEDWQEILERHHGGGLPDVELRHLLDPEEADFQRMEIKVPERTA